MKLYQTSIIQLHFKNKTTGAAVTEIKDAGTYEVIVTFNTLYEGEVAKEITVVNNSGTTPADTTPGGYK